MDSTSAWREGSIRIREVCSLAIACLILAGLMCCGGQVPGAVSPTAPISPTVAPPLASPTALPTAPPTPTAPTATPIPPIATRAPTVAAIPPSATPIPTRTPVSLAALSLELELVVTGLDVPVGVAHADDGSGRLFIVEKPGRIRVIAHGQVRGAPFLDLTDRVRSTGSEQGLLGLAFHPAFTQNSFFFVNYTDRAGDTVVARFTVGTEADQADPASETTILTVDQPAANHNGGHLAFGPDGMLYVGLGDGGGAGDRYRNGQNGRSLLGKMLRLDVDGGRPYAVPADNPFATSSEVRGEIWALGLRNPWRYSFDRLTGDLIIADVGQDQYEEVDLEPAGQQGGQNYGWPIMEGAHCYPAGATCDRAGLALPVVEYDHAQGCSVTGGYVYRGQDFPALEGVYVYGDYCSGRIWGMAPDGSRGWQVAELARADVQLSSFGEDEAGELYALDMGRGELFRLIVRPQP